MELPRAEIKSSFGTKLEAKLKRFWFGYFVISVFSIGIVFACFVVPWAVSLYRGEDISLANAKTEAEKLRDRIRETAPKRRKEYWDHNIFFVRQAADRGDTSVTREIFGFGTKDSEDMKWFLGRLTEEGLKYSWDSPDYPENRYLVISW